MMHTRLERLRREEECTAVLVAHDVSEAVVLTDRIIPDRRNRPGADK